MNDLLGAAPYTPERPSTWARITAWWRSLHAPPPLAHPLRGCGAYHPGFCLRDHERSVTEGLDDRCLTAAPPLRPPWCGRLHQGACDGGPICRGDLVLPLR